ncbi:MAG: lysozyme inhibitor LprI family protein [Oscillatoria sp. PMC 1068.18]|nr:lysozyme inhibitor LprI family protein [Oscillatoria sp. PMC 1076.18]MEC4990902.1 lysozyme inhibitor LprI family protein [Oscillatoria sp. PMC 1068.18]
MSTSKNLFLSVALIAIAAVGCSQPSTTENQNNVVSSEVPREQPQVELVNTRRNNCADAQTQQQINNCAATEAQTADEKLNQLYQQLQAELKGSSQEKHLISAQQKWLQFRDADCEYARKQYEGGTFEPAAYSFCLNRLTNQRITDLQEYLETNQL